ncbi:MAG: efflux RND transporter periplasmic adaptor subunit [Gammaproteobacteria bacterium]
MKKMFKLITYAVTIIGFITFLAACGSSDKSKRAGKQEIVTLESQPLATTLYYSGIIQPLKTVVVTSPADGVVQEMLFHYGDQIKEGEKLFTISSEKFQTDYKTALMAYIKAKNEFNTSHSQLMQSEFLHKNQLISDDEFKTKQSGFYNAQLAQLQAKETLNAMLKQLTVQGFSIDELNIENIDKITQALNSQGDSQKLRVASPTAGVVLLPTKSDNDTETKKIGKGDQVKQGDVLAVIGDTSGVTIRVSVNEFNINQLQIGQKVKVTGAAFPDYILEGKISGIDRQAQASASGMPTFPIEIIVPILPPKSRSVIHIGMSAKVEIHVEGEPQITVPIPAIIEKDGRTFVSAKDLKTGKIRQVPVKTGQTTADAVAIESSLKVGDQVVFTR